MASTPQPAEDSPGTAGSSRFVLLYLGAFLIYGDRFAIAPMLLTIADDLGEPLAAVTIIATLYFLLYGVMQFPYGLASDRLGRVRVMRFALLGLAVANLAAALAPTLPLLIAAKALAAGTAAAILPTSLVYVGDRVPFDRRQRVVANVLAAGSLGTTLATVGGGLAARLDVWRAVFAAFAVLALVAGLALGRLPESLPQARTGGSLSRIRSVFRSRWAVLVIVLAVAEGTVMVGLLTYLPPALEASGQTAAIAGLVVAAYGVAVFTCMQLVKRLLRHTALPPAALIAIGGALLTAAWTVAAAEQSVVAIVTASVLIGFGYSFAHSTLQTWATEVAPQARGTATSLFVTGVYTGAAIGAGTMSGLADAGRYGLLFALAAAATVPIMAAAALARRRYMNPAPGGHAYQGVPGQGRPTPTGAMAIPVEGDSMTSADKRRVRKALEGANFPADKAYLFAYAAERSAEPKTREALQALPDGHYESIDHVERCVPQSPEAELGDAAEG